MYLSVDVVVRPAPFVAVAVRVWPPRPLPKPVTVQAETPEVASVAVQWIAEALGRPAGTYDLAPTPVNAGAEGGVESRLMVSGIAVVPPALVAVQVSAAVASPGAAGSQPVSADDRRLGVRDGPGHASPGCDTSRWRRRAPPA